MYLDDLIHMLEAQPIDKVVEFGFDYPHSHRGDYYDLAFRPARNVTVSRMLGSARSAEGTTYEGWKGGEFTMSRHSRCYLAYPGECGDEISELTLGYMLGLPIAEVANDIWKED